MRGKFCIGSLEAIWRRRWKFQYNNPDQSMVRIASAKYNPDLREGIVAFTKQLVLRLGSQERQLHNAELMIQLEGFTHSFHSFDRFQDVQITSAAADIARKIFADVLLLWIGVLVQQCDR
jgi:hypothetical protein